MLISHRSRFIASLSFLQYKVAPCNVVKLPNFCLLCRLTVLRYAPDDLVKLLMTTAFFLLSFSVLATPSPLKGLTDEQILDRYAPLVHQEIGRIPLYDSVTSWDFDGTLKGSDNVKNSETMDLPAGIYGAITAETQDAYYIYYGVYHIRDYDARIREFLFNSAAHDNDLEGAMLLVEKKTGKVIAMETWFHSIFLQFTNEEIKGTQSIDGNIVFDNETHPILYVEDKGHGVRAYQPTDKTKVSFYEHLTYRLGKPITPDVKKAKNKTALYKVLSFDIFIENGAGPFDSESMFEEPSGYGMGKAVIGRYLSGPFRGNNTWARPKPPWNWGDKFDSLQVGAWYFHPAYVFNLHFGLEYSETYVRNKAFTAFFPDVTQKELGEWARQERDDMFFPRVSDKSFFSKAYNKIKKWLYQFIEPVFMYFG